MVLINRSSYTIQTILLNISMVPHNPKKKISSPSYHTPPRHSPPPSQPLNPPHLTPGQSKSAAVRPRRFLGSPPCLSRRAFSSNALITHGRRRLASASGARARAQPAINERALPALLSSPVHGARRAWVEPPWCARAAA